MINADGWIYGKKNAFPLLNGKLDYIHIFMDS